MMEGGKLKVIQGIFAIAALCALIGIILSAISMSGSGSQFPSMSLDLSQGGGGSSQQVVVVNMGDSSGMNSGPKEWLICIGHDYGAHEYIDEFGGLQGFTKDIVTAACDAGGMSCRFIWDKYVNCWDSQAGDHPSPGSGLMSGWYDACADWTATTLRLASVDFSYAFFKPNLIYFYVRPEDIGTFNPKDISGKTIGFMDGWVPDEKCLARQTDIKGSYLPKDKIYHALLMQDLIDSLQNKSIDAFISDLQTWEIYVNKGLIKVVRDVSFPCMLSGFSMMTKKDNNFNYFFNRGLQTIKTNGVLKRICDEAPQKHGHKGPLNECVD